MFNPLKKLFKKGRNRRTVKVPKPARLAIAADGPFAVFDKHGYFYGPYGGNRRLLHINNFINDELIIECGKEVKWQVTVKEEKGEYVDPEPVAIPLDFKGQSTEDTVRQMFIEQKVADYYNTQGKEVLSFEDFALIENAMDSEEKEFISPYEINDTQEEFLQDEYVNEKFIKLSGDESPSISGQSVRPGREIDPKTDEGDELFTDKTHP